MKTRIFWILFAALVFLSAPQAHAEGEVIHLKGGASGWLVFPVPTEGSAQGGRYPAIILIHEWWGLNDQIKGLAEELAQKGYATFSIDLYRGKSTDDPMKALELMRGLPEDQALADLKASADYLRTHPRIDGAKTGVMGWSMGGGFALKLALADPEIKAVVTYYGKPVTDEKELAKLNGPLLGLFGEEDRGIPVDSVNEFEFRLIQLGKRVNIRLYPHAGHGFANPSNKDGYRADAADDAWRKTLEFLRANL